MTSTARYQPVTENQVKVLARQGCTAEDWESVLVAASFDPGCIRQSHFAGEVRIAAQAGQVYSATDLAKPAGIYHATIINCTIGPDVRIANVGVHLANYDIAAGACIEDVGTMETRPDAQFGNGVEIEVLNEGGGREIILFNELSAQFAYLMCLHRYRPKLIDKLSSIAHAAAMQARADRGRVGVGARICSVGRIIDVQIGDAARITGATSLVNGTILSSPDAPGIVGDAVQAHDFIIAEGAQVDSGAIVAKSYIGQGCQIGKQFSVEGSVFFANSEGFHGEACSIFAGPYTVTHHKSTLLIAGLFSFYNAGSGTNQSNHLYKLGPLHEGKLERGCKTGSFSYMMWPCRVGPFSVVLGKHSRTFDTSDLPFSFIEATSTGHCALVPGLNLATVGTVRDGAKWPARDRRQGAVKRDRICFDVLSPFTVGRMLKGTDILKKVQDSTDKSVDTVTINGAQIKRVLLRSGQKFYRTGIEMYLLEKVFARIEALHNSATGSLGDSLAGATDAVFSEQWVDIAGQLMPSQRLADLYQAIESGAVTNLADFDAQLDAIRAAYDGDQWIWVRNVYEQVFGQSLDTFDDQKVAALADAVLASKRKFINMILADANKEFAQVTQTGFGQDGSADDAPADFGAVRGEYEENKFVKQMRQSIVDLESRIKRVKELLSIE